MYVHSRTDTMFHVERFSTLLATRSRPILSSNATLIPPMILEALHRIADHRESLSRDEARAVMSQVLAGRCTDAQIAALLVALHMKGETVEEIVGFAEAIRAAAMPLTIHQNSTVDVS